MIEKDIIDEIIFRTDHPRNRLMLELMARGGLRIGEVLNLHPMDCEGCKLILSDTKGGKEIEVAFIPQKISDRLKDYIQHIGINPQSRIFPISYTAAWSIVHSTASQQNFSNKTFRITHPFHPYRNIEFEIDSVRRSA
ncbi:MAG: site-specific integrase [Deltaproteobacteria bacterium]|nr:site-specific integrase [Deltaproteobacteria bacterium]